MSEQPLIPADAVEQNEPYEQSAAAYFHDGLERAEALGFDLHTAVSRDYGEAAPDAPERADRVRSTAVQLGEELALDKDFFERPAHTILLTAIADAWVHTEDRAASDSHDSRLTDERAALVDAAMILAGDKSGVVRDLAATDRNYRERYVEADDEDPAAAERDAYLESLVDPELSVELRAVFEADGEDSLVAEQRARLGLTKESEQPFEVKVLKMASNWELQQAGVLEPVPWPDWDDASLSFEDKRALGDVALAEKKRQDEFAAPYEAAREEYKRRFGDKFGDLPPAFVTIKQGETPVLYMQAHDAYAVLNYFRDGKPYPAEIFSQRQIEGQYALARHEYSHTQKQLTIGPHNQLGMLLEERKAELVSGDKHGYNDVKNMVTDLSYVSGVSLLDELGEALKTDDALSTFVAGAANKVGLKDTLMLVVGKPLPYDNSPDHARHFVDLKGLRRESDRSVHDAIVRGALERKGDEAIRTHTESWLQRLAADGKNLDILEGWFSYRRAHGSTHGTRYFQQAYQRHRDKSPKADL